MKVPRSSKGVVKHARSEATDVMFRKRESVLTPDERVSAEQFRFKRKVELIVMTRDTAHSADVEVPCHDPRGRAQRPHVAKHVRCDVGWMWARGCALRSAPGRWVGSAAAGCWDIHTTVLAGSASGRTI